MHIGLSRTMPWQYVCLSIRLSVCQSHAFYSVKTVIYILKIFDHRIAPNTLVFPYQTGWQYSDWVRGHWRSFKLGTGVWKNHDSRFISKVMQDRAIYYGRRIGSCTQAFEWYQFEWSSVTSNPDFKVTILFNVKKLENGTRYLQWPTNRKSHVVYRTAPFSTTLNDP